MLAGCAAPDPPRAANSAPPSASRLAVAVGPATAPADRKATLTLKEIQPHVLLATTAPTTAPAPPPIEAVLLYAQARIATLEGRRYAAAGLLEKALARDPGSFLLHQSLAELYAAASDPRALQEWERAAELEPDRLDTQIRLARQYIAEADFDSALRHLWMALATTDYQAGHPSSGEAEFLLARILQQQGYDRAALQLYERVLGRLSHPALALRRNPQLMALLVHPESLALRIAALYEKHGEFAAALHLLSGVAQRDPSDFEVQARIVRDTAATGDKPGAVRAAVALLVRSHADPQSVQLLRDLTGSDSAATDTLLRLWHDHPDDRQALYALVDLMSAQHRPDADRLIDEGLHRWPDDLPLLRRQVDRLRGRRQLVDAAKLLIAALGRRPDRELELMPVWDTLIRPSQFGWLRVGDVQRLSEAADLEPARLVLLARAAGQWRRDTLKRDALARAVQVRPAYAPAFRDSLALVWSDASQSEPQKEEAGRRLIESARQSGDAMLAAELNGKMLLERKQPRLAALAFAGAAKAGDRSPELYLNFAAALHDMQNDRGAQTLLWKLIADRPFCHEAYLRLYDLYAARKEGEQARKVLSTWLTADPQSVAARRAEARDAFLDRRYSVTERILLDLLQDHSDDPDVLAALLEFFSQTDRLSEFTAKLQERLAAEPWNFTLAAMLAETHADLGHTADATRVIDQMRKTADGDPDLLYQVAGLYSRVGNSGAADQALAAVLGIDPQFAGANNDLAYSWAQQGKNLDEAEALVKRALSAEPDNPSFLDSMGWVLYKRGKFAEALATLSKAAGPDAQADPIVLDHLGDTLYRLGDVGQAARRWRQAAGRLPTAAQDDGDEAKQLRNQLLKKQQQLSAGQPVLVAPVIERR